MTYRRRACGGSGESAQLRLLLGDLFALLPGFRQADGDRLLTALDLAALPTGSAFGFAPLITMHLAFDVRPGTLGILAFGGLLLILRRRSSTPASEVTAFMEAHVESYGIEPMCRVLRIAPSTWHEHARRKANPDLRSTRAKEDERLSEEIIRVHNKNYGVYGARKVWLQLNREGFKVGRTASLG